MNTRIWMPLYWGDYHQKTQHLTTWQHGAYMLLLGAYWMTGKAIAKANAQAIARALPEQKDELDAVLLEFFVIGNDGLLHNKRLDEELAKAMKISKARSKAGKTGAKAKQAKAPAKDKQLPTQSQSQSQSQSSKEDKPIEVDWNSSEAMKRYGMKPQPVAANPSALADATTAEDFARAMFGGTR